MIFIMEYLVAIKQGRRFTQTDTKGVQNISLNLKAHGVCTVWFV